MKAVVNSFHLKYALGEQRFASRIPSSKLENVSKDAEYRVWYHNNCVLCSLSKCLTVAFFRLMTQWRFNRGIEEQTKAFLDGFNEVVPLYWLQYFDEKEIEVIRQ